MNGSSIIYVELLDEAVAVWRPVEAEELSPGRYRLKGPIPDEERWQFQPGDIVDCESRTFEGGAVKLVAVRLGGG